MMHGARPAGFTGILNFVTEPIQFAYLNVRRVSNTVTISDAADFYFALIRQFTPRTSASNIKAIQSHILTSGFPLLKFGNKLINGYLKCGSIVDARKLFDEMPVRHIVIWNSMISCYIRSKRSKDAVGIFKRMVPDGVFPDEFTFSSIFKAFSELNLEREGRGAHGLCVSLGVDCSNAFVSSGLVDMYAKFGKMTDAEKVLDRVVEKDVVLFTAMIVGFTQQGEDAEALRIFRCMIDEGIEGNEYTFSSVLIACGNLGHLGDGKLIHSLIVKLGFESVVAPQTSLLTMYSKCGLVDESLKVFEQLAHRNQVTWTSLIAGFVQNGREEMGLMKFREMIRYSVCPNSFTLSSVLRACSSLAMLEEGRQIHAIVTKFGLDIDRYAGAALIDLYGKCGSTQLARMVFDSFVEIDVVSMNSMICCYAQNGLGHEALKLFHLMKDMQLQPNDVTFVSVLLACNNAGLVEQGREIFASMKSNYDFEPSRDHYACMVDLLGRAGRLEEAETLVKQFTNPDVVLWRTLLSACKIHGNVEMVERIKSRVLKLAPGDGGTHILLSNIYASTGNWNEVIKIKSTMKEIKVKKNPAMSWVDVDKEVHTFMAGDWSHPCSREILKKLEELTEKVKILGYVPDTRFVWQDLADDNKEKSLYHHSERLAIAFALWKTSNKTTPIRILKNLRVCGDCHSWIKLVSKVVQREISARDAKRFHHFKDGFCSCKDYW